MRAVAATTVIVATAPMISLMEMSLEVNTVCRRHSPLLLLHEAILCGAPLPLVQRLSEVPTGTYLSLTSLARVSSGCDGLNSFQYALLCKAPVEVTWALNNQVTRLVRTVLRGGIGAVMRVCAQHLFIHACDFVQRCGLACNAKLS